MKHTILLIFVFVLLAGCSGYYPKKIGDPVPQLAREKMIDPDSGEPQKYWIPVFDKEEKVSPLQAREEERLCMYRLYEGKNISELHHPNMTHKTLPKKKHQLWTYSISYVVQTTKSVGFFKPDEVIRISYSTVFNIFTDLNGDVISCSWVRGTPDYLAERRAKESQGEARPAQ